LAFIQERRVLKVPEVGPAVQIRYKGTVAILQKKLTVLFYVISFQGQCFVVTKL